MIGASRPTPGDRVLTIALGLLPLALGLPACSETPYDLIGDPAAFATTGGSKGDGDGDGDGDGEPAKTGGTGAGGSSTGGFGQGGEDSGFSSPGCEAARDPRLTVERIVSVPSGFCIAQGGPILLASQPGFEAVLQECDALRWQHWTMLAGEQGYLEIQNENARMNLDVKYAATDDGTPAVLFAPHLLYNQLFSLRPVTTDTFQLAPRHVPGKCLEARGTELEIWPCDNTKLEQTFQRIACEDSVSP